MNSKYRPISSPGHRLVTSNSAFNRLRQERVEWVELWRHPNLESLGYIFVADSIQYHITTVPRYLATILWTSYQNWNSDIDSSLLQVEPWFSHRLGYDFSLGFSRVHGAKLNVVFDFSYIYIFVIHGSKNSEQRIKSCTYYGWQHVSSISTYFRNSKLGCVAGRYTG